MTPMREAQLEAVFMKRVRMALGGRVEKLAPTRRGMPDRLVLLPAGRMYLVELKTDTGRVSPIQAVWHEHARRLGTTVHIIRGLAAIDEWIQEVSDAVYVPEPRRPKPGKAKADRNKTQTW